MAMERGERASGRSWKDGPSVAVGNPEGVWPKAVGPPGFVVVVQSPSHVRLFATPWTAVHQASLPKELIKGHHGQKTTFQGWWLKMLLRTKRGTSLVVQWMIRICLPVQGTWVWSLVWEDSTFLGATKPVFHNVWACTLEPSSHNYQAHMLQLVTPLCLVLHNKRSPCNEMPVPPKEG